MITIRIDEKDTSLLTVSFPEDSVGNDLIRQIPGRRWSYSRRNWVVPNVRASVVLLGHLFGREYFRFDEAVVRIYKPAATPAEIEQATDNASASNPLRSSPTPVRPAPGYHCCVQHASGTVVQP